MTDEQRLFPPIPLFLAHAPQTVRGDWKWLWHLDQRLVRLASEPSEPMLAQIRLAWWRDQLSGAGKMQERRDPALVRLDAMAPDRRDVLEKAALRLVDAMEAMKVEEAPLPLAGAEARGVALASAYTALAGLTSEQAGAIGSYWGLAQLAPAMAQETEFLDRALMLAADCPQRLPRALSLMRRHADLLISAGGRPLGRRAGLSLAWHGLTGL